MKKNIFNLILVLGLSLVVGFSFSSMPEANAQEPGTSTVPCADVEALPETGSFRHRRCATEKCPWFWDNYATTNGTCTIKNSGPSLQQL